MTQGQTGSIIYLLTHVRYVSYNMMTQGQTGSIIYLLTHVRYVSYNVMTQGQTGSIIYLLTHVRSVSTRQTHACIETRDYAVTLRRRRR